MNITLLKGFCLSLLAWLGITITTPNGWLYIHVQEGSAGWYLLYAVCLISMVSGVHKIYTYCRRKITRYIRCCKLQRFINLRKRNA